MEGEPQLRRRSGRDHWIASPHLLSAWHRSCIALFGIRRRSERVWFPHRRWMNKKRPQPRRCEATCGRSALSPRTRLSPCLQSSSAWLSACDGMMRRQLGAPPRPRSNRSSRPRRRASRPPLPSLPSRPHRLPCHPPIRHRPPHHRPSCRPHPFHPPLLPWWLLPYVPRPSSLRMSSTETEMGTEMGTARARVKGIKKNPPPP